MTTVVISQPMLFPWPGFFELASLADIYVHLDDVQFSKGSFTNRIQIKHRTGVKWMTIPLAGKGAFQRICELKPSGVDWKRSHRELLIHSLQDAPHVETALDLFDRVYAHEELLPLLTASIEETMGLMKLSRPSAWLMASHLGVDGASWERVLEIVKAVGGTRYVTAHGAANYIDHDAFERAGVVVEYIEYSKTLYVQRHGPFVPFVSVLDTIGNLGPSACTVIRPKLIPWRQFLQQRGAI